MSNEKCIFQLSNGVYQKEKEKRILNRFINIYGHISLVRGIIDFYSLYLSRISYKLILNRTKNNKTFTLR